MSLIEHLARLGRRIRLPLASSLRLPLRLRMKAPRVLGVHLAPQQVSCVIRQGERPVAGSVRQIAVVNPGGHWQASVDALHVLLHQQSAEWRGLAMEISLSSRWSQMVVTPWSDALLAEPTATRFLQSQLMALYGDAARGWNIVSDDAPYGQARAVCGIDSALLHALQTLNADGGQPCRVIEPLLSTALRTLASAESRIRKNADRAQAIALIEPGRITMAALHAGRITAMQPQPAGAEWRIELPQAWQRWTLRMPELANIDHVAVVDLSATRHTPQGALKLVAQALPPRFRMIDHPFAAGITLPTHADEASPEQAA